VIREGTIMAWRGGVPVGVVITVFDHDLTRAGEIETLAVTPANQGVGLGSALLRTALVAAADRGCTVVTLSVSAANRRALALYLDAGFTVADVRVCWEAHLGGIAG
jgi:ribosomal protein S18 acetylase RimI-like enzyme